MQRTFLISVHTTDITFDTPQLSTDFNSSSPVAAIKNNGAKKSSTHLRRSFWTLLLAGVALQNSSFAAPQTTVVKSSTTKTQSKATASKAKTTATKASPKTTTVTSSNTPQSQISMLKAGRPAPSSNINSVQSETATHVVTTEVEWKPASTTAKSTPAAVAVEPATVESVVEPATSSPIRLTQAVPGAIDTDKAPAAPVENPPALVVPVKPDEADKPAPAPAQPTDGTAPATPAPTVETSPSTPVAPLQDTGLAPADAEGREIAVVRVVGNRVINEDTIFLSVAATKPGAAFSIRQADLDRSRIRELGYFAAVDYQVVPNLQDPNKVDVVFVVIENRVVSGFRFEGAKQLKNSDLEAVLVSKTGAVLSSKNVDEDVKKIQETYRAQGFAALVTDVHQDADGTVVYVLQEGLISRVELEGLKKTKPSIVRSQILTRPGDPFNEQNIQKDLNRIYDTGYFEDVSYKISDDPEKPGALIVTMVLKERRTGQISFGVGFDSRSKLSGFGGVSDSNFRGTGKNISAQVELGAQRSFNLGFGDRFVGSNNASYSINLYDQTTFREPRSIERVLGVPTNNTQTFEYEERRQGTRLNYTHPLDFDRSRNILLGYRLEKVRLSLRDSGGSTPIDLPEDADGRTGALSIGFLRDRRDLKLDPSRGGRELLTIEQGASFFGGTSNFTKADLDIRRYFPLIGAGKRKPGQPAPLPRLVLAGRLVLGQTFGQLPVFEQYFVGGSDTVRGYDSDEQYGDNQIFGNIEFRYRLQRKIQLVAFADAGTAYGGQFSSSDSFSALFGVGVGARLQTPIGPVRLDIARGDRGVKTHFGIGSTF
jgi:outer membrane protein insertion porin family